MFCLLGHIFPVTPDFIMLQLLNFYEVLNKKNKTCSNLQTMCW